MKMFGLRRSICSRCGRATGRPRASADAENRLDFRIAEGGVQIVDVLVDGATGVAPFLTRIAAEFGLEAEVFDSAGGRLQAVRIGDVGGGGDERHSVGGTQCLGVLRSVRGLGLSQCGGG